MANDPLCYDLRNLVYSKQFVYAENLLAANPCLFDQCDGMGETVLHFLAIENDIEGVEWLFARGFSLNTKNRFGTPIVFDVASGGHRDMLLWLFQHGADFSILDSKQRDILTYLRRSLIYLNKDQDEKHILRVEEVTQFLLENFPWLRNAGSADC